MRFHIWRKHRRAALAYALREFDRTYDMPHSEQEREWWWISKVRPLLIAHGITPSNESGTDQ